MGNTLVTASTIGEQLAKFVIAKQEVIYHPDSVNSYCNWMTAR